MAASERRHTGISGRRQLSIRRHNQQLFTNEAALGPVRQIIDNRLIWLCLIFNNLIFNNFQRPDRVCCSFSPTLKFSRLIQISHIDERRKFFSVSPTGLLYFVDGFEETAFSLIATAHLIVQGAAFSPTKLTTCPQAEASPRHTDDQTSALQAYG